MSRKSVKRNYVYNVIYQILRVIMPLVTTPYVARVLSTESIGTYGFTISIVTYFILIGSLGIDLYGQREIAFVHKNEKKRSEVFWSLLLLKCITMSISTIVFYFVFARTGDLSGYYKILILEIVANLLDISWLFQGMEDFKKTVMRNMIVKISSVVAIFCFVRTADDLWIYLLIYCLTTLLGSLSLWPSVRKYVNKPSKINIKPHLKPVLVLFLPQIATQVYTVLDKSMLGWLSDMDQVGFYEQVQKIVKVFLAFITALGTVMMPHVAGCYAAGEVGKIREYMKKTFRYVFFVGCPICMGIVAVAPRFVPLFFGNEYEPAIMIMQIISAIVLFIGLSNVSGIQYLLPTKKQKEYTISILAGTFANMLLNLIFIPLWKGNGAAVATVVAELAVMVTQFFFIRKVFPFGKVLQLGARYMIFSVIMLCVCLLVNLILPEGWIGLILEGIIGGTVYLACLIVTKDPVVLWTNKLIKRKIEERK